jgi:hypothetical protein
MILRNALNDARTSFPKVAAHPAVVSSPLRRRRQTVLEATDLAAIDLTDILSSAS